jgi:hypothetical protein
MPQEEITDFNKLPEGQIKLMMQVGFKVIQDVVQRGECHVTRRPDGEFYFHDKAEFEFKKPIVHQDMGDRQAAAELLKRGFDREYIKAFIRERRQERPGAGGAEPIEG